MAKKPDADPNERNTRPFEVLRRVRLDRLYKVGEGIELTKAEFDGLPEGSVKPATAETPEPAKS